MPRGVSLKTPERLAKVLALRAGGATYDEIANETGLPYRTVWHWIDDPTGEKKRARVDSYRTPCIKCGALTDGSIGRRREGEDAVCRRCAPNHYRIWDRDAIVCAIQEWADQNGGIPPTATDWNPAMARAIDKPEKADKFSEACWPHVVTVQSYFGTWNAAIKAAGFEPRPPGNYGRDGEDPTIVQEIADQYRSGVSGYRLAKIYGCTSEAIYYRLEKAGVPRRAANARWAA